MLMMMRGDERYVGNVMRDRHLQFAERGGPPKIPNSCGTETNVHVAGVQEVGGTPLGLRILLINLKANQFRILVAAFDVVD